ncbi:MAG: aldo/keto reductase, partial [Deltaproteobacteria bacterium]|nr:aldo/keto reductase [Deltaproteobacteria bacterium]
MMENQNWLITSAGVKMPRIIYGTAWKKDRTGDLVVKAIQTGFRGIDTACQPKHYNEALVGTALQRLKSHCIEREELFLQTKFTPLSGQDP